MQIKKLTPGEISDVIEKIRKRYDEYIYKYFKPKILKGAFEDRYLDALRNNLDISSFLLAEISVIEELIRNEEERVAAVPVEPAQKEEKKTLADKVLEENRKKIEKYEDVFIHQDAREEIRKLLGALNELDVKYWGGLATILRNTPYSMNSITMINMEAQLRYLGNVTSEGVPQRLERYLAMLKAFPRDYHALDREEKEYILEVSFFLHDLLDLLVMVAEGYEEKKNFNKNDLDEIIKYISGIIVDFRLKDLKRKK